MYRTLYTILEDSARVPWVHLAIGLVAVVVLVWRTWRVVQKGTLRRNWSALLFLGVWATFWNVGLVPASLRIYRNHARFAGYLRAGDCQVAEGTVDAFHPMPRGGHALESFTVGGIRFEYSDFDDSKPGFNHTASHGGPVRGGMRVRIHHREGSILQIEVPE
jgi:hypothetical protein